MKRTVLYDKHIELNAKMIEFAGYMMPLQYQGITEEHLATRNDCGVFDVSHMGEILITGKETRKFVDYIFSGKIPNTNKMSYGFLLNENGGIVDDLMIYYFDDEQILFVVNASNLEKDFEWIKKHKEGYDVKVENISNDLAQLAIQGPNAEKHLVRLVSTRISDLKLFDFAKFIFLEEELIISRSGYTGEDGFEVYSSKKAILHLFNALIENGATPCGLGARDTLRFEAAMPLYGNEIDENINPIEAGLKFGVDFSKDFIGKNALEKVIETGVARKLVALELLDRGIARHGYDVEKGGNRIGYITTGYMIPGQNKAYALAYLDLDYTSLGTVVDIKVRNRLISSVVRNKKFLNKKYKK
ncbi:MAG TPA: glycine cleavage system aminomethyltransferase GcvT [Acholeplasmataceae bacterium]|nr:glycine cleavage system aminomethyltransferase GcvT [Acholeplasmataceae bacterium]